ncbi:MAG: CapA family protein [Lachnospiraceae bacterium]|nr:CapA family protein [Lachnospiraceae bacterium]
MKHLVKGLGIGFVSGILLVAAYLLLFQANSYTAQPEGIVETAENEAGSSVEAEKAEAENEESVEGTISEAEDSELKETEEQEAVEEDEEAESDGEFSNTAVLAFAGDVLFSDIYLSAYDSSGITAIVDTEMLSHMQNADLFLLNEEFPFSLRGEAKEGKQYTFRTDPKYVSILQDLGTDIVTLANNHALDYGQDAFCDTLDTLNQAGITYIGGGYDLTEASAPAVYTVNGQSFAIFGATRVSPSYDWYATDSQPGLFQTYDPTRLNAAIAEADAEYDHVIVFVHWGVERSETPEDYQRTLAQGYIDAGADLIVGCHPHVLQGFEYYNGVPIVYSLGNYLFSNQTGETLLLEASFGTDSSLDIQLVPCQRKGSGQALSVISTPETLYSRLTELSFGAEITADGTLQAIQ